MNASLFDDAAIKNALVRLANVEIYVVSSGDLATLLDSKFVVLFQMFDHVEQLNVAGYEPEARIVISCVHL